MNTIKYSRLCSEQQELAGSVDKLVASIGAARGALDADASPGRRKKLGGA